MRTQLMWIEEIGARLNVHIEFDHTENGHVQSYGPIHGAKAADAHAEMAQIEMNLEQLHYSLLLLRGDPLRRNACYQHSADLNGQTPQQAIIDAGLGCIDAVLLGPDKAAAEMLANDARLYAAAKTRVLYAHQLDEWTSRVRHLISFADSILARRAIDEMLEQQR
jgi:hypothetical protein